ALQPTVIMQPPAFGAVPPAVADGGPVSAAPSTPGVAAAWPSPPALPRCGPPDPPPLPASSPTTSAPLPPHADANCRGSSRSCTSTPPDTSTDPFAHPRGARP